MTPQLQPAIKVLQLSTLDLQMEIQQALESNPMLEMEEEEDTATEEETPLEAETESDAAVDETGDYDDAWQEQLTDDLPVDTQWEDLLPSSAPSPAGEMADVDQDSRRADGQSLQDHLLWQLNLTRMSDTDHVIAMAIIDATDDEGRVTETLEDIHESLCDDLTDSEIEIDLDEVVAVLRMLQQFEPAGVCARDLEECLRIQLQQLPSDTPYLEQAKILILRHMNQLASRDFAQIMRRMRIDEDALRDVLLVVQSLDPHPGLGIGEDRTEYIVPDVFVRKREGRWVVELNPDIAPRLRINEQYANMVRRADQSDDNNFLRDNLQEARWFLKSLQSRNETLMKVATKIVEHQRNFLEYGEEAMKPLVLHDIAEAVEMHESTISRVTTRKYMHTPRGIFELKYFFSSHVATTSGGECSSTAIRALIKKLVSAENPSKPLSDSKITQLLEDQGIKVARRTVAKYRDTLLIPPSNERKRLV